MGIPFRKPRRPVDLCARRMRRILIDHFVAAMNWIRRKEWLLFIEAVVRSNCRVMVYDVTISMATSSSFTEKVLTNEQLNRFIASFL